MALDFTLEQDIPGADDPEEGGWPRSWRFPRSIDPAAPRDPDPIVPEPPAAPVQRMTMADFVRQAKLAAADHGTAGAPSAEAPGAPPAPDDPSVGFTWDVASRPPQTVRDAGGAPAPADPSANAPRPANAPGNIDSASPGLPRNWDGTAPAIEPAPAALGQKARPGAPEATAVAPALAASTAALPQANPAMAAASDPGRAHAAIDAHFETLYAAPEANARMGWFNTGELTPQALALRSRLDAQKARAHVRLGAMSDQAA